MAFILKHQGQSRVILFYSSLMKEQSYNIGDRVDLSSFSSDKSDMFLPGEGDLALVTHLLLASKEALTTYLARDASDTSD